MNNDIQISDIENASNAYLTGTEQKNGAQEWAITGTLNGRKVIAYLLFSEDDLTWDDGSEKNAEDLNWDDAEVRIEYQG